MEQANNRLGGPRIDDDEESIHAQYSGNNGGNGKDEVVEETIIEEPEFEEEIDIGDVDQNELEDIAEEVEEVSQQNDEEFLAETEDFANNSRGSRNTEQPYEDYIRDQVKKIKEGVDKKLEERINEGVELEKQRVIEDSVLRRLTRIVYKMLRKEYKPNIKVNRNKVAEKVREDYVTELMDDTKELEECVSWITGTKKSVNADIDTKEGELKECTERHKYADERKKYLQKERKKLSEERKNYLKMKAQDPKNMKYKNMLQTTKKGITHYDKLIQRYTSAMNDLQGIAESKTQEREGLKKELLTYEGLQKYVEENLSDVRLEASRMNRGIGNVVGEGTVTLEKTCERIAKVRGKIKKSKGILEPVYEGMSNIFKKTQEIQKNGMRDTSPKEKEFYSAVSNYDKQKVRQSNNIMEQLREEFDI